MKKILSILIMVCACIGIASAKGNGRADIVFEKSTVDLGTIKEEKGAVAAEFKFTNKGTAPLVITSATAACGCTKPYFETEPIAPGKSSSIKVTYNPKGRPGEFTKTITVRTNDPKHKKVFLKITGVVVPRESK